MGKLDKILEKEYNIPEEIEELANEWSEGWWNYRVVEKEHAWKSQATGKEYFQKYFEIHEVYYDKDGKIIAWAEKPLNLQLEYFTEWKFLKKSIDRAIRKPILRYIPASDMEDEDLVPTKMYLKKVKEDYISNFDVEAEWNAIEKETEREQS